MLAVTLAGIMFLFITYFLARRTIKKRPAAYSCKISGSIAKAANRRPLFQVLSNLNDITTCHI